MFPPFLISIIVGLIIVGLLLYLVSVIPMDATIKQIIHVVLIVFVCLWLISILLGYSGATVFPHPR